MEEENWCMQWSGEVLPEPAMIPDLSVFLCTVAVRHQVVTVRGSSQISLSAYEPFCVESQGTFPARLRLPFTLLPAEDRERPCAVSETF